jgi:hypothetical protein
MAPEESFDLCRECRINEYKWRNKIAKELEKALDSSTLFDYTFTRKQTILDIVRRYNGI